MVLLFILVFCALIALGFGGAAAWSDYARMVIPNLYSVAIILSFIPAFAATKILAPDFAYFANWQSHVIAFVMIFAISYILFLTKIIGGGDSKLLSVYALWVGLEGLLPLLFFMTFIGGLLAVATIFIQKWKPFKKPAKASWIAKAQKGKQEVPYGIAIFLGAIVSFWQIGYFNTEALVSLASQTSGY